MRSLGFALAIVGAALFLVACATAPPRRPVDIQVSPPQQWTGADYPPTAVIVDWWVTFDSKPLTQVIQEALTSNPDLRLAAARIDAAAAEARITGSGMVPAVGLGVDAGRSKRNFLGFPIPSGNDAVLSTQVTTFGLGLNTAWEIDLWGRMRSATAARLADVQASADDLDALRNSLAAQTAKSWMAVVASWQQWELVQDTRDSFVKTADQIQGRYERGLRSALDLRLARNNVAVAKAEVADSEVRHDRAVRQLEILLGRYPSGSYLEAIEFPAQPSQIPAGLPSDLLLRRPDLRAAERRVAASQSRLHESKASLLPRLSLTANGGTSTDDLAKLVSPEYGIWTLAGNIAQPLFEGGRLRAGVDLSKARQRGELAAFEKAALQAFSEVESGLAAEQRLVETVRHLRDAATEANASLSLANERYAAGLEGFLAVLESQRRAFNSQSALIEARRQRLANRIDLHLALGGNFSNVPPAGNKAEPSQFPQLAKSP